MNHLMNSCCPQPQSRKHHKTSFQPRGTKKSLKRCLYICDYGECKFNTYHSANKQDLANHKYEQHFHNKVKAFYKCADCSYTFIPNPLTNHNNALKHMKGVHGYKSCWVHQKPFLCTKDGGLSFTAAVIACSKCSFTSHSIREQKSHSQMHDQQRHMKCSLCSSLYNGIYLNSKAKAHCCYKVSAPSKEEIFLFTEDGGHSYKPYPNTTPCCKRLPKK